MEDNSKGPNIPLHLIRQRWPQCQVRLAHSHVLAHTRSQAFALLSRSDESFRSRVSLPMRAMARLFRFSSGSIRLLRVRLRSLCSFPINGQGGRCVLQHSLCGKSFIHSWNDPLIEGQQRALRSCREWVACFKRLVHKRPIPTTKHIQQWLFRTLP
jgi:hypothetical protein